MRGVLVLGRVEIVEKGTKHMAARKELWMPPLSSEEQKRLDHDPRKWGKTLFRLTGLRGKTLWDLVQLLIIPVALALTTMWFNSAQHDKDTQLALDKQRQDAFVTYQKDISDLLLSSKLNPPVEKSTQEVAKAKTSTILRQLDPLRKGFLVKFLYEAELIKVFFHPGSTTPSTIISLDDTDLRGINLGSSIGLNTSNSYGFYPTGEPNGCNLSSINLQGANLKDASFKNANLKDANLRSTYLGSADFSGANLQGAYVSKEQLMQAKSLKGATMPDGSKHA
jgi:hypothetical protein